jgi:hypothetical protein
MENNKIEHPVQLFELEWHTFDSNNSFLFIHPNKDQKQFKKDVRFMLKKYGEEYLNNCVEYQSPHVRDWIEFIVDKMPELGYQIVNPIKEKFQSMKIDKDNDRYGDFNKKWGNVIGKKLLNLALQQNEKIEKFCKEQRDKILNNEK